MPPMARKERHIEFIAHAFDDADQRIFLDPHFRTELLPFPHVDAELLRAATDDFLRSIPMREAHQVARTVLDRVPVDEAAQARVVDDGAQAFVFALLVG